MARFCRHVARVVRFRVLAVPRPQPCCPCAHGNVVRQDIHLERWPATVLMERGAEAARASTAEPSAAPSRGEAFAALGLPPPGSEVYGITGAVNSDTPLSRDHESTRALEVAMRCVLQCITCHGVVGSPRTLWACLVGFAASSGLKKHPSRQNIGCGCWRKSEACLLRFANKLPRAASKVMPAAAAVC